MRIGEGGADTVFAYFEWMNTQGLHDGQHGGRGIAIALEFDNDQVGKRALDAGLQVLPDESGINSESLGLVSVDERDALKRGAQTRLKRRPVVPAPLLHEVAYFFRRMSDDVLIGNEYALLLGATFVVLILNLEEGGVGLHIGANTHFLTVQLAVVMMQIHLVSGGVVVERIVWRNRQTINHLYVVVGGGETQYLLQLRERSDILGIDAVHQFDGLHLLKSDGGKLLQYVGYGSQNGGLFFKFVFEYFDGV